MKKIAIVRGKFLNRYEMQFFEPLIRRYDITAFGSLTPYHDQFAFPVVKLPSPMDLPDFPYKMPVLNRLFIDAHYLHGLEERLNGFDLVHTAETYFRYTQQCLTAREQGRVKKVIATVLENIPHNNEGIWGRRAYKARARRELDHIIALTEKTKQALMEEGADPQKISVIRHYVDTKRFTPSGGRSSGRGLTILFAGRLETYKGVLDIADAAMQLAKNPDFRRYFITWMFVGRGSQEANLRLKMQKLPKFWHSRYESAIYSEMPAFYRSADIFVAPSSPTPTWEEQYCTVLLEAQAAGLPIVTTKTGGIPENVGSAAVVVTPGDAKQLARAIGAFIRSPSMRRDFGRRARRRATMVHDASIGADMLAALYARVLSE